MGKSACGLPLTRFCIFLWLFANRKPKSVEPECEKTGQRIFCTVCRKYATTQESKMARGATRHTLFWAAFVSHTCDQICIKVDFWLTRFLALRFHQKMTNCIFISRNLPKRRSRTSGGPPEPQRTTFLFCSVAESGNANVQLCRFFQNLPKWRSRHNRAQTLAKLSEQSRFEVGHKNEVFDLF